MRMSERRYDRDRRALDVGAKLVDFEVRTTTICNLTGLSATRIRMLYRACGVGAGSPLIRHRGCAPRSIDTLLAKTNARSEAACLLGLCKLMGVEAKEAAAARLDLVSSDRLCEVYATYRAMMPHARFTFEQLLLLLATTDRGTVLKTDCCPHCNALILVDRLDLADPICLQCDTAAGAYLPNEQLRPMRAAERRGRYLTGRRARG
jgi:hypothetical protein